ncbi:MAG: decaprenyl-phosphate phosphoribosyltransferase [Myxococcota bacterium]
MASGSTPAREGSLIGGVIKAMRPHQWVKNGFVVAPLVFAKLVGDPAMMMRSFAAAVFFSFAASCIYLMNDIADIEADRAHPKKRFRPIPSGRVPIKVARGVMVALALMALAGAALLNWKTLATIGGYIALQIAYTFRLKRVAYLDVLCIAAGFELRVLAGSFALDVTPSNYLLAVTALISLFLGFGKRMHELRQGKGATKQRSALGKYSEKSLTVLLQMTALATTGTYVVYTLDPETRAFFGTDYLAGTIIFTEFGILRFLDLMRNQTDAASPTEQMLKDWPFLLNLVAWAIAVVVVIYVT